MSTQIRSYPMAASTSPERKLKDSSPPKLLINQSNSTSIIKKSSLENIQSVKI